MLLGCWARLSSATFALQAASSTTRRCACAYPQMVDLDRHLSVSQRAEATAFTALVEAKLQPAIVYTTWVEADAFSQHTCAAYGGGMPFPLSYFMPRSQRRAVQRHFAATPSAQVGGDLQQLDHLNIVAATNWLLRQLAAGIMLPRPPLSRHMLPPSLGAGVPGCR
jgi:hypothetical protein